MVNLGNEWRCLSSAEDACSYPGLVLDLIIVRPSIVFIGAFRALGDAITMIIPMS